MQNAPVFDIQKGNAKYEWTKDHVFFLEHCVLLRQNSK